MALELLEPVRWSAELLDHPAALGWALARTLGVVVLALLAVRLSAKVLVTAFPESTAVRRIQQVWSWGIWIAIVLWISGLQPMIAEELDSVHWRLGGERVSMLTVLEAAVSVVVVMLVTLWLASAVERRLLALFPAGGDPGELSMRKIAANVVRTALLVVGVLMALSAAGIPLTALSVFGGALGVGIGLGLQRLAANYVSGFVILAERSLRIGDTVKVDNFEGRISDINTRYTVIRSITGRESIVPNEMLLTQRIENATLADSRLLITSTLLLDNATDLEPLTPQLIAAMAAIPRVLADPAPSVQLARFAPEGLELQLLFWIADPDNGQGNVRSEVNLAVLRLLREQGVQFPIATRVIRHQ